MIKKKNETFGIEIDLTGPNGNAFYLLKVAKEYAHSMGMKASPIMSEMCAGTDYYKLVKVFEKYFGHFVVLETNNPELLKYMQK